MEPNSLASKIDHTILRPNASKADIEKLCQEAKRYSFFSVCIAPEHVTQASLLLKDSTVKVCTVVGFPLGYNVSLAKANEATLAIKDGAQEIDMVLKIGALLEGREQAVREDIRAVVKAANGILLKVILETSYLNDNQIISACRLAEEAGAQYVKTSTGFSSRGASLNDIKVMKASVSADMGIKASGGIRTTADAMAMIEQGATRLGCSSSVAICSL